MEMEEKNKNKIIIIISIILFIAGIVLVIINNSSKGKNDNDENKILLNCEKTTENSTDYSLTLTITGYREYNVDKLKLSYKQTFNKQLDDESKQKLVDYTVALLKQSDLDVTTRSEGNSMIMEYETLLSEYDETYTFKDLKGDLESSGYKCK